MADFTPASRAEEILQSIIDGEEWNGMPHSRGEELLLELKEAIEAGGGGGGEGAKSLTPEQLASLLALIPDTN